MHLLRRERLGEGMRSAFNNLLVTLGYDTSDPGDLVDFAMDARNVFLLIGWIIVSLSMAWFLFGDGSAPPEPQWWIEFRAALFAWIGMTP